MFDYVVFIGRFQPFHAGHYHVAKKALEISKNLIIVIGSHDKARDSRNPFTTQERIDIIKAAFENDSDRLFLKNFERIHFAPQYDHPYNEEKWIAGVQASVNTISHRAFNAGPIKIGIIGYNKDHSSFYLKKFPIWELIEVEPLKWAEGQLHNATDLRADYFLDEAAYKKFRFINQTHYETFLKFAKPIKKQIADEMRHVALYKKSWKDAPYTPTFVTVDTVVTQSGHVLFVKRGAQPGEDLWALPGGFLNQHETLREGALRELKEETKIDVPLPVLAGSILRQHTFDDPHRSTRGRTITHCFHIRLTDQEKLPKIKGSDDAKKAKWFSLNEFVRMRSQMFEDHFSIVEYMLGL